MLEDLMCQGSLNCVLLFHMAVACGITAFTFLCNRLNSFCEYVVALRRAFDCMFYWGILT